ncbi:MAG: translation elongation factor Ts [Bacillota bacterium]|nr:translation elongation factor Ts [Bacillota bacterium]MDI9414567.1 translation elongation factor Ts [Bacillota bacterium]NLD13357.1 translation elongation factor Ts [Bacillota bacterium]HAV21255.1 elongation factor Ts [Bacillota bacterium]HOB88278.1 translation elongation factor Ts [Bacillota bacterium]
MAIKAEDVKKLREKTGAGMMDCKKALAETGGDMEKAVAYLREKGLARMVRRADRVAAEGIVEAYIHHGSKVGVLVEVNCETDFVARTDDFRALAKEIALQVAASKPLFVSREDVPEELIENEKAILKAQALNEGKPEHIAEKIVEGRIVKFYQEVCLLEQPYIRDSEKTIYDLLMEVSAKTGEKMEIKRFVRFEVGEGIDPADKPQCAIG